MKILQRNIKNVIWSATLRKQLERSFTDINPKCPPCADSIKGQISPPPPVEEDLSKFPPELQALKKKQMFFQKDDGNPIWLKTPGDRILSQTTFALTGLGLLMVVHLIYTLMFPSEEKKELK